MFLLNLKNKKLIIYIYRKIQQLLEKFTLIFLAGIGGVIKGVNWIRAFKESIDNPVDVCEGYESSKKSLEQRYR